MRLLEEVVKDVLNKLSLEKKTSLQKRIERYIKRYNKLDEVKVEKDDSPGKKGAPIKGRQSKEKDSDSDSEDADMFE